VRRVNRPLAADKARLARHLGALGGRGRPEGRPAKRRPPDRRTRAPQAAATLQRSTPPKPCPTPHGSRPAGRPHAAPLTVCPPGLLSRGAGTRYPTPRIGLRGKPSASPAWSLRRSASAALGTSNSRSTSRSSAYWTRNGLPPAEPGSCHLPPRPGADRRRGSAPRLALCDEQPRSSSVTRTPPSASLCSLPCVGVPWFYARARDFWVEVRRQSASEGGLICMSG
jgi:hypothetical protein